MKQSLKAAKFTLTYNLPSHYMSDNQALQRIEPEGGDVIVHQPLPPPSLFGTADPAEVVVRASRVAEVLKSVIVAKGLISKISGKEYPRCEAWTLLGTMLGVFPVCIWTRPVEGGWEARVEARTRDGAVVGAAEAQCLKSERNWSNRDDFALRSMSQTRATAKALRMPLGFVMTLGGYEPTPAEEMDFDRPHAPTGTGTAKPPGSEISEPGVAGKSEISNLKSQISERVATEKTRVWFLAEMRKVFPEKTILQWGVDHTNPTYLLPNQHLEDWPLLLTPTSKAALARMIEQCTRFMNVAPEPQNLKSEISNLKSPERPPSTSEAPAQSASEAHVTPKKAVYGDAPENQPWYRAIVPVPYKGQKRDDYLKRPDTIGELYNLRHDDERARARLFGFLHNYEPKGWVKKSGEQMPPSEADRKFRADLDAFGDWFEKNHPDEVKNG